VTRYTPPGGPIELDVPDGHEIFHAVVLFEDPERRFECDVVARDREQAELRVREMLLSDPSVKGIVAVYGDPTTIEIFTLEEWARRPPLE
jgi:hypothetical protein